MQPSPLQKTSPVLRARELIAELPVFPLGPNDSFNLRQTAVQEGVEVLSWVGKFHDPITIDMLDDSERIHFSFLIRGSLSCQLMQPGKTQCYSASENFGGIIYTPDRQWNLTRHGAQEHISVMIKPDMLSAWGIEADAALGRLIADGNCFACGYSAAELNATARQLNSAMQNGGRHPLWIQAQALTLVALLLEQRCPRCEGKGTINPSERQRLLRARDVLLADLQQAPTLPEIASETGLTLLRLKRGFRQLFGHSVYGLFQHERMHEARRQLETDELGVSQVASRLGYTNMSHFAAAFRKQFGFNPSALKHSGTSVTRGQIRRRHPDAVCCAIEETDL